MPAPLSVTTAMVWGMSAQVVNVEVSMSGGLPGIVIVGRPDSSVMESRSRVRCAIRASGFRVPREAVTVNLSPSEVRKSGTAFDLPIALAILAASGQISRKGLRDCLVVGELSLQGEIRPVRGVMAYAELARERGLRLICPAQPLTGHGHDGIDGRFVHTLGEFGGGVTEAGEPLETVTRGGEAPSDPDFSEIAGQEVAKRGIAIACAGNLGMLMVGPPGIGKTMLARCVPGILPRLDDEERFETMLVHSVAGVSDSRVEAGLRPFRAPHHSASVAGLVGGGRPVRPGEVSLAHKGVLFLDELGEFPANTLQSLRQPMEERRVRVVRAEGSYEFPCDFQLIAASNPCPCGHLGDVGTTCTCSATAIQGYRSKLTGPLTDRIDIMCTLDRPQAADILSGALGTSSDDLRGLVESAREFASWRHSESMILSGERPRTERMTSRVARMVEEYQLTGEAVDKLNSASLMGALSVRGIVSVLRIARTIADMEQRERVELLQVLEALCYRDPTIAE